MEESSSAAHGGMLENSTAPVVLWFCAGIIFLICPFVASSNRRKLCATRIRQRRWNVTGQNSRDWYREAANRLEERSRHRHENGEPALTMEEEEEIRQLFLVQQLSQYTMAISSDDIKMRVDTEKHTSADTCTSNESSASLAGDIESGSVLAALKSLEDNKSDSDVDHEVFDEFEESNRIVTVVAAGESIWPLDCTKETRDVANGCAVCLCEFYPRDQVTWSANKICPHVFHSNCILQWMLALGRKEQRRRRQHPERSTGDPLKDVVTFGMPCPCCRQQFVNKPEDIPSLTPQQSTTDESQSGSMSSDESQAAASTEEIQAAAASTSHLAGGTE